MEDKEDSEVVATILRMENKKLGGVLTEICKLLKTVNTENKYFDEADVNKRLNELESQLCGAKKKRIDLLEIKINSLETIYDAWVKDFDKRLRESGEPKDSKRVEEPVRYGDVCKECGLQICECEPKR